MPRYLFTSASVKNGGVFQFDSGSQRVERVLEGSYRGLTAAPDGSIYTVSGCRNRPDLDRASIHRIDPHNWSSRLVVEHALKDTHDLRWIGNHFYLVASLGNRVVQLDSECRIVDELQIVRDETDVCHVNCLVELGGELYASIFTLSPGERKEKRFTGAWHSEGKILKLDFERKAYTIWFEPLAQPHSLVAWNGALYLVESHLSRLTRIDILRDVPNAAPLAQLHGFLRGLAIRHDEAVLGVCRILKKDRKQSRDVPLWSRIWERFRPHTGLAVLDTRTWRVRKRVEVPLTEIYEILPLP